MGYFAFPIEQPQISLSKAEKIAHTSTISMVLGCLLRTADKVYYHQQQSTGHFILYYCTEVREQ